MLAARIITSSTFCSSCPRGDDPKTIQQTYEVQSITCKATSGTFKLKFRQYVTPPLPFDATEADVTQALVGLKTVGLRKHESTDGLAMGKGGWLGSDRSVSIYSHITAFESGVLKTTFTKKWKVLGCVGFIFVDGCNHGDVAKRHAAQRAHLPCSQQLTAGALASAGGFCQGLDGRLLHSRTSACRT